MDKKRIESVFMLAISSSRLDPIGLRKAIIDKDEHLCIEFLKDLDPSRKFLMPLSHRILCEEVLEEERKLCHETVDKIFDSFKSLLESEKCSE